MYKMFKQLLNYNFLCFAQVQIFNIQILTVMKKTFISSIVESNKKPNQNTKTDKNVKNPPKSISQQHKENIHPNLTYHNSIKKYQKLKSESKFKSNHKGRSSNKKIQTYQPEEESYLSPFKCNTEQQQRKQLSQDLRKKCSKLKQMLKAKHEKQIKKCREYYNFIRQQLYAHQLASISEINKCFQQADQQIAKYRLKIDNLTSTRANSLELAIELPLLTVSITQQMKQSIRIELSKLNLMNENHQFQGSKMQKNFQGIKLQTNSPPKPYQTPKQLESYYNQRETYKRQGYQYYRTGNHQQYELSPSFRRF